MSTSHMLDGNRATSGNNSTCSSPPEESLAGPSSSSAILISTAAAAAAAAVQAWPQDAQSGPSSDATTSPAIPLPIAAIYLPAPSLRSPGCGDPPSEFHSASSSISSLEPLFNTEPSSFQAAPPPSAPFPLLQLPDHLVTRVLSAAWQTFDGPGRHSLRLTSHAVRECVDHLVRVLRLNLAEHFPHVATCAAKAPPTGSEDLTRPDGTDVEAAALQLPTSPHLQFGLEGDGWTAEDTEEGDPAEYLPGSDAADLGFLRRPGQEAGLSTFGGASTSQAQLNTVDGSASGIATGSRQEAAAASPVQSSSTTDCLELVPSRSDTGQLFSSSGDGQLCINCKESIARVSRRFPNLLHLEVRDAEGDCFAPCQSFLSTLLIGWSSLKALALRPGSQITLSAEDIGLLGKVCPQLEQLLVPAPLYDDALSRLPDSLPNLNTLYFGNFWKTPPLGVLAPLSSLTCLKVRAVILATDSMHGLSTLTNLRELRLGPVYHMTSAELAPIAHLPSLQCLHLWAMFGMNPEHDENGLSNPDLEAFFTKLTRLQALSLHNFPTGQADDGLFRALGRLPNLRALRINSRGKVTQAPAEDVFPSLNKLHVGGDRLEVKMLKGLGLGVLKPQLQELVLESVGSHMVDKVLKMLKKQTNLRHVSIRCVDGWPLSRLSILSALPQLETLSIVVSAENLRPKQEVMEELQLSMPNTRLMVSVNPLLDLVRFEDDLLPASWRDL